MTEPKTVRLPPCPALQMLRNSDGSQAHYTGANMIDWVVQTHPRFNTSRPGRRQGERICNAAETGTPLLLDDAKSLLVALDSPTRGYGAFYDGANNEVPLPPGFGRRCVEFVDAIDEAVKSAEEEYAKAEKLAQNGTTAAATPAPPA